MGLLITLKLLDALVRRWQIFGHSTTKPLDRVAHLAPNFKMRLVRSTLAFDIFPAQFSIRLGCAEDIVSQFLAAHKVEDTLFLGEFLARMNGIFSQTAIQTTIPVIRECRKIAWGDYSGQFGCVIQFLIPSSNLGSVDEPALILWQGCYLFCQFLSACLDCEIGLAQRNDRFPLRVCILHNQIASVARKMDSRPGTPGSFANFDQLTQVGEMI